MNLRRLSMAATLLSFVAIAPASLADTINYSFSGLGSTATFSLPSNPTPSVVGANYFQVNDVTVMISGVGTFTGNIDFFDTAAGGGAGSGVNVLNGPQLFSGDLANPTLSTGSFLLSGSVTPDSDGPIHISGTLNAVSSTSPVPEPSSLALLLTGLASFAAAALLRKKRELLELHPISGR